MRRLLALAAAVALAASACGGDSASENPKQALRDALRNLLEGDGVTLELTLQSDAESLSAASEGELSEDDVDKFLQSSVRVSALRAEEPADQETEVFVNLAGEDAIELRQIGFDLYARADVSYIAETFGEDPSEIEQGLSQAPPGLEWLQDAVAGDWIHFTDTREFIEQLGAPTKGTGDEQDAARQLAQALTRSSQVRAVGEEDPGTHLVVEVPLRAVYKEFVEVAKGLQTVPGAALPPEDEVPDKNFEFDAWVDGDTLTQVEFDIVRLNREFADSPDDQIPEGVERLAIRITFDEFSGGVDAPDAATKVSLQQLIQSFFGGFGGLGGAPGTGTGDTPMAPGDVDCTQFEGTPKDVLDQIKDELEPVCPELYE